MTTVGELIREGSSLLEHCSPSATLDAQIILGFVSELTRIQIISNREHPVTDEVAKQFRLLVARRAHREPVAYLIGEKEFWGLEFKVSPAVLIPRPETELLVETVIRKSSQIKGIIRILELGVGSGCIMVSIAHELKKLGREVAIMGVDISADAIKIARTNAEAHGVGDEIEIRKGSWFDPIRGDEKFNFILSNPPYIAEGDVNVSPETAFEPRIALYAGAEGLSAYRAIFSKAFTHLEQSGALLCEIGADQRKALTHELRELGISGELISFKKDLSGHDRMLEVNLGG